MLKAKVRERYYYYLRMSLESGQKEPVLELEPLYYRMRLRV